MAVINETQSWTENAAEQKEVAYEKFYCEYKNYFGIDSKILADIAKDSFNKDYDFVFHDVSYAMTLCRYIYNTSTDIPEKENERIRSISGNSILTIKKAHSAKYGVNNSGIHRIEKGTDIDPYIKVINKKILETGFKQVRSKKEDAVFRIRTSEIFNEGDSKNPFYKYDSKTKLLTFLKHAIVLDIYSSDSFEYFMNNAFMLSRLNDSFDTWVFKKLIDEILKKKKVLEFDDKKDLLDVISSLEGRSNKIAAFIRNADEMRIHVKNTEENHEIDENKINALLEEGFKPVDFPTYVSTEAKDINTQIRNYLEERSNRRKIERKFVSEFRGEISNIHGDIYLDHIKRGSRSIDRDLIIRCTLRKNKRSGVKYDFKNEYIPIFAEDWITDCNTWLKQLEYKELNFKRPYELLALVSLLKDPSAPLEFLKDLTGGFEHEDNKRI